MAGGILGRIPVKHLKGLLDRPLLIPKVVRNYGVLALRGRPVLRSVDLATTFDCQVRCAHCYSGAMRDDGREPMTYDEILRTIDACLDLGALAINLAGGESLLDERIYDIVGYVKPWKAVSVVTTNGLLLSEEVVCRLKARGLDLLAVSIDAAEREGHDRFRGYEGLFDVAKEGLQHARREGLSVMINTMVSPKTLQDGSVGRMIRLARSVGATLNLIIPGYAGEQRQHGSTVLDPASRTLLKRYLALPDVRWDGSSNYLGEGCGAGVEKIAITPYGDVLACALIQASFGNVRDEPLEEIWKRMLGVGPLARINETCLAADDPVFVESCMKRIAREEKLPCPAWKIFPEIRQ